MKENSIEEDIARIAKLITTKFNNDYSIDNKDKEAIEHILSAYKRVLKENEQLNKKVDLMENYMVENGWEICFDNIYAELNNCNGMERDWCRGDKLEKQDIHKYFCKKLLESEEEMNEKEKKAIERIEDTFYSDLGKGINKFQKITLYEDSIRDVRILLNLIEKLQKENKEWQETYQEEKDKIIDLMANHIATTDSNLCEYLDITTKCKYRAGENKKICDECIRKYFENEAKEK